MAKAKDSEKSGSGDDAEVVAKPAPVAKAKTVIDCPVAIGALFTATDEDGVVHTYQRTPNGALKL